MCLSVFFSARPRHTPLNYSVQKTRRPTDSIYRLRKRAVWRSSKIASQRNGTIFEIRTVAV